MVYSRQPTVQTDWLMLSWQFGRRIWFVKLGTPSLQLFLAVLHFELHWTHAVVIEFVECEGAVGRVHKWHNIRKHHSEIELGLEQSCQITFCVSLVYARAWRLVVEIFVGESRLGEVKMVVRDLDRSPHTKRQNSVPQYYAPVFWSEDPKLPRKKMHLPPQSFSRLSFLYWQW